MKNLFLVLVLGVLSINASFASVDHSIWNRLLKENVSSSGTVNYKGFKIKMDTLDAYIQVLRDTKPKSDWSLGERKSFYMNAYNAYTVKFLLVKYPVQSVKDASYSGKDIWHLKLVNIGGTSYTLNYLENEILRKMNDPRIHFGINCAAQTCPKLWNRAFIAKNVNSQLTTLTKAYINNTKYNVISAKKVKLSEIFNWYATDFTSEGKTIIDYLNKYSTLTINADAKVEYLPYDWSLNE
ncbi:DUF547 domain-containing protein [Crocinitomix catalasitica]|uniref:DUF547 domain-containing protein n=1 Tax=Crocinitomix catalasitica TaxID=184607 RepID=UPI000483E6C6|nr:DUF547 domain-containing protein [Crocinitomix catalasitica]